MRNDEYPDRLLRLTWPELLACATAAVGSLLLVLNGRAGYGAAFWLVSAAMVCLGLMRKSDEEEDDPRC
jgi:hypothetical protein